MKTESKPYKGSGQNLPGRGNGSLLESGSS